jgi:hypothetical protein
MCRLEGAYAILRILIDNKKIGDYNLGVSTVLTSQ